MFKLSGKPVKIVFLDFDGVLNSHAYMASLQAEQRGGVMGLDPAAVARLNRLLAETGAEIVVSSAWRHGRTRTQLCDVLYAAGLIGVVRAKTPEYIASGDPENERGHEIQAWLDDHAPRLGVDAFIIIDDNSDMAHLGHRLVQTTFADGLTDEHVDRAIAMLAAP